MRTRRLPQYRFDAANAGNGILSVHGAMSSPASGNLDASVWRSCGFHHKLKRPLEQKTGLATPINIRPAAMSRAGLRNESHGGN
jgi:hypothetical protein